MEKVTKREMYEQILTHLTDESEIAFIKHEMELLAKKNARRSDKPTAKQIETVALAEKVLAYMKPETAYTVSELQKSVPALAGLTPQKVTGIMRVLLKAESVMRSENKGKAYFTKS